MPNASILIITSGPLCQNPRSLKEALTLSVAGYAVRVLYPCHDDQHVRLDRELCRDSAVTLSPLRHTRRFFSRASTSFARKLIRFGVELPSALGPVHDLKTAALAQPAALTLLHNEAPQQLARLLLKQDRRFAADFEDWYSEDLLPTARRHRPLRLLRASEHFLLHHAAYTSTTSSALAAALHAQHGGTPPVVIPNTFPLQPNPRRSTANAETSFLWFSQTIGPGRGLEQFLNAWALTKQPGRVVLLGNLSPSYDEKLRALLPASHRERLSFLPPVSPDELPALIARHDIGLALEPNEPANKNLTISNKLFQYLNAGLGVIATPTAGQREVFAHDASIGVLDDLSSPAALAARLDEFLADSAKIDAMGGAARRLAEQKFCWEKTAPLLLAAVSQALSSK